MKSYLLYGLLAAGLCSAHSAAAQDYYWVKGQKVSFTRDSSRFVIETPEGLTFEQVTQYFAARAATPQVQRGTQATRFLVKLPSSLYQVSEYRRLAPELPITATYYALKLSNGALVTPTGDINFKPKAGIAYETILSKIGAELTLVKKTEYNTFLVHPRKPAQLLRIANQLYESGLVEWSEPDLYMDMLPTQDDPLYPSQYYLNNTGQGGGANDIDINAPEAWCLSKGSSAIRVAVLDDGVETHEDIYPTRLTSGYNPDNSSSGGAPASSTDAHGQACAGIIAATHNTLGPAGIAPYVTLVPVRVLGAINYSASQVADAINWAWNQGAADVLSNSWELRSGSNAIASAIQNARIYGRHNLGCVVVFGSGNGSTNVSFPASEPGVVTVGAVDRRGNLSYYSNTGSEMDLVAPSGNLSGTGDVTTLDRMGSAGDNGGNYRSNFGGTSAACPQVAAVAALVLSANPNLTNNQVQSVLTSTATDMGPFGFDNSFGYGRVNALNALLTTYAQVISLNGPHVLCSGSSTYILTNLPNNGYDCTSTWSSSDPSIATVVGTDNTTGSVSVVGSGTVTITARVVNSCGYVFYASTTILINSAPPAIDLTSVTYDACKFRAAYRIANYNPDFTYSLTVSSSLNSSLSSLSGANVSIRGRSNMPNGGDFTLTATACGQTTTYYGYVDWSGCSMLVATEPSQASSAYPNPATESFALPEGAAKAVLLDTNGNVVRQATATGQVDVRALPGGLYNLRMQVNGKMINQHIQVQH